MNLDNKKAQKERRKEQRLKKKELKRKKSQIIKINIRYNLLSVITYVIGIILIITLFKIQIIDGLEYRKNSNARLIKRTTIEAKRGDILDRTGKPLVTDTLNYKLEIYKTKIEEEKLNEAILNLVNILEKNKQNYRKVEYIKIKPFKFMLKGEELSAWKENHNIPEQASAEEAFYILRDYYKIKNDKKEDISKILNVRNLIEKEGYGQISGLELSNKINPETALEIEANSRNMPGVTVVAKPERKYNVTRLASHVLGYMGKISEEEYNVKKNHGYNMTDNIGKTGIERTFEGFLKGKNGSKLVEMTLDGKVIAEYIQKEAIGGDNVILTIDSDIQRITQKALRNRILSLRRKGYRIDGGSAVVLNVKNGEILSMASYPDYAPKDFLGGISEANWKKYNSPEHPLMNRAIQGNYAPRISI